MDYTALTKTIEELSDCTAYQSLFHQQREGASIPSGVALARIMDLARAILFPGYYGNSKVNAATLPYHIGVNVEELHALLVEQIKAAVCFANEHKEQGRSTSIPCEQSGRQLAAEVIATLPRIRQILSTDVQAAYDGDPAAESMGEVICCYPVIRALTNYRLAHEMAKLNIPLLPRMLTEMAHSETGIDIHPRAQIGEYFTIDHGTGVVIGATCIIGKHVKLYQGVTLGAKSIPTDEDGKAIRGQMRHPIIEDNVIIYSNATILGRITIGKGATVGGNIWVTESVPPGERIVQSKR